MPIIAGQFFLKRSWKHFSETDKSICIAKSAYAKVEVKKTLEILQAQYDIPENIFIPITSLNRKYSNFDL